ncbi:extracellular solute-binding protein [Paenibacillus sp. J5C_2022]|uniref:ABC transporter substrate-binding protein n=1 Tax=Paenibacillus sp. J5C2022 TaxID=2977129 RepID=UPI0021D0AC27|nr:extracellular solute-binding protein [Paenibacillus sp. J5C2022]MCU6711776.1 extracellular solute-binding protein [Paenibacillus sp. J5C2022]
MWKQTKKIVPAAVLASMVAVTGCSTGGNSESGNEQATVKVMYYDEGSFFREYGMLFSALFPEIEIEVVSTQSLYRSRGEGDEEFDYEKAQQEFIEREQPDILMLDSGQFEKMAQDGKLYDIEALMTKDKFDTEGLVPGMVDYMKEMGGGQLYGLPTSFTSQVIYYNKDLFDKYNLQPPTDGMTWEQVIQLAQLFPTDGEGEDRVYGLNLGYRSSLNDLAMMLGTSEGLKFVIPATKQVTFNTDAWKNVVNKAHSVIQSGALYDESKDTLLQNQENDMMYRHYALRNPFVSGRAAMTLEGSHFIREMKDAKEYGGEDAKVVENWDIVTMPVSVQNPESSDSTWYSNILSIAKDSPNADAAWKLISYISSDEYARVKSKVIDYGGFPIRTKYIKDEEGRNFAAFYKLKPSRQDMYKDYDKLPQQFTMMFYDHIRTEFQAITDGTKTVDEALELLQVKGEELMAQEDMTEEEIQKYYDEKYKDERNAMREAAGEVIVEEEAADTDTAE